MPIAIVKYFTVDDFLKILFFYNEYYRNYSILSQKS